MQFVIRAVLSGLIIAAVALIARRSPAAGALVASLPLVSLMGMAWLWHDTGDRERLAAHVEATFWYVLPSLPMFLAIPAAIRHGVAVTPAILGGCLLTFLLYLGVIAVAARFGVKL